MTLSGLLNFVDGLWSSCGDERIIIFTTNHIEKLGAGMGMHQAVPVAPVFGGAHVQQFGDVPVHRADAGGVYLVSFVAHDGFPNFLSCAACRNGQV